MDKKNFSYQSVMQIGTSILTAIALLLIGFGVIADDRAPDPAPVSSGGIEAVTGFDDLDVAGDLDVGDDVTFWAGDVYPLGSETNDLALFASEAIVTGSLVITAATHGLTSIESALCALDSAIGNDAGDPAICYSIRNGTTITLTVLQDDLSTEASNPATIDYILVGAPD